MSNRGARIRAFLLLVLLLPALLPHLAGAQPVSGTASLHVRLKKLRNLGRVMMIAAHPDDENTALLAWSALGRGYATAYLSITRGEGGQNLIGPEQGALLGVIRTEELLAARKIDGALQFFSRAIDFGYSKSAGETLAKWGREEVLADLVWHIRRFRPDVIIQRFSGTPRDGHGHHQASGILAREAFEAAGDPSRFPGQLRDLKPWKAKRLVWNAFSFTPQQEREALSNAPIVVDTGEYSPVLGHSYAEIAGMSRSMHRSQGFGAEERRGSLKNYLRIIAGQPAGSDLFDGINTSWSRSPGGEAIDKALQAAQDAYAPDHPEQMLPHLAAARARMAASTDPVAREKIEELDELMAEAAGLWFDAQADEWNLTAGRSVLVSAVLLRRGQEPVTVSSGATGAAESIVLPGLPATLEQNRPMRFSVHVRVPPGTPPSEPYWLVRPAKGTLYDVSSRELAAPSNPPLLTVEVTLRVAGTGVHLRRPVHFRYVDRILGERVRPVSVVPPLTARFPLRTILFQPGETKTVELRATHAGSGEWPAPRLNLNNGWTATPVDATVTHSEPGEPKDLRYRVTAPSRTATVKVVPEVSPGEPVRDIVFLSYPHIPVQPVFPPAGAQFTSAPVRIAVRRAGYVMGAGDEVPDALREMGCETTLLSDSDLVTGNLNQFDVIVTGIRAYNVRPALRTARSRLLDFIKNGGTLLVQYNVLEGGFVAGDSSFLSRIGPYPMAIGRTRVAVEDSPVRFAEPPSPLLRTPNAISEKDFEGWVQERGLYFAESWDKRYRSLFELADPGEPPHAGGTLYCFYGKGAFVFTPLSWFRQLPSGVPGAYRIFANLLSAGKTLDAHRTAP